VVNRDFHGKHSAVIQRTDDELWIHDFEISATVNHASGNFTRTLTAKAELLCTIRVQLQRQRFNVQDNVGYVFTYACDGGELVQNAINLNGGHCGTSQGGQENTAQRVTQSSTKTTLEWLRDDRSLTERFITRCDIESRRLNQVRPVTLHAADTSCIRVHRLSLAQ
jgi:hypothetical protein